MIFNTGGTGMIFTTLKHFSIIAIYFQNVTPNVYDHQQRRVNYVQKHLYTVVIARSVELDSHQVQLDTLCLHVHAMTNKINQCM